MADHEQIDFTYSLTDRIIRLSLGESADFSGAKYDGDFTLTLEQAQRRKHEYVAEQIGIEPGRRVLDLGCGWGGLLNYIRNMGATGLGVTLSSAQVAACRRHGLDAAAEFRRLAVAAAIRRLDIAHTGRRTAACVAEPAEFGDGRWNVGKRRFQRHERRDECPHRSA